MKNGLKITLALIALLLITVACGKKTMPITPVDNYYLRYHIKPTDSIAFYVIRNQADFDNHFAPQEGKEATPVNFEQNNIAAIVCYDTKYRVHLKVLDAKQSDETGSVYYQYTNTGDTLSYTINAMCMFTIPKDVSTIKFIDETGASKRLTEISWEE